MKGYINVRERPQPPRRHWPGKAPAEAIPSSSDESDEDTDRDNSVVREQDVAKTGDFASSDSSAESDIGLDQTHENSDSNEGELESRRAKLRQSLLARRQDEDRENDTQSEVWSASSEETLSSAFDESSEECEEEEKDSYKPLVLARPVFISKSDRTKEYNPESIKAQDDARREQVMREQEEKKREARQLISENIEREKLKDSSERDNKLEEVDDTDHPGDEIEYSKWRLRELSRLKRAEEAIISREEEKRAAIERSKLSNEEIVVEKAKEGRLLSQKSKSKLKFLQRYYHRGAFYLDDSETKELLSKRDFTAPTLEDKFDKASMPLVMQVKNFGRSGRVKYTHLTDQDTSKLGPNWYGTKERQDKLLEKHGGYSNDFSRPTKKKKVGS